MKTYNNLWEQFISIENFVKAYKDARRGKGKQRTVAEFRHGWALKLYKLRKDVIAGKFHTSKYKSEVIYEPKKRTIYKLPFNPDRIVQHAIVNVLAPILERKFIVDTYSCIPNRGQIKASQRCMKAVRRNKYCLKCDIHHFYPSIDQNILSNMFHKIIKDKKFMQVLDDVIFSFKGGKNAPIGNYLSQWCGNFYLSGLDNFIKRELKIKDYIRYCDDFMLFENNKTYLHFCRKEIEKYIHENLLLEFSKSDLFNVKQGVDFCGYRHFNNFILLRKSTKLRQKKRIIKMFRDFNNKKKIEYYRHSLASMKGWLIHAKTKKLIKQWNINKLELLLYTKK